MESSKALSAPPPHHDDDDEDEPVPSPSSHRDSKKASVHFSVTSPTIIPPRDDEEEEEEEEEEPEPEIRHQPPPAAVKTNGASSRGAVGGIPAIALYDFTADGEDELSVQEGEDLVILEQDGDEWWKCRNTHGAEGVVPASYLEVSLFRFV